MDACELCFKDILRNPRKQNLRSDALEVECLKPRPAHFVDLTALRSRFCALARAVNSVVKVLVNRGLAEGA